jgi:hypothetical protein
MSDFILYVKLSLLFDCLDGTRSGYFGHATPILEEYLPLDEHLDPPPAVDLGVFYSFDYII